MFIAPRNPLAEEVLKAIESFERSEEVGEVRRLVAALSLEEVAVEEAAFYQSVDAARVGVLRDWLEAENFDLGAALREV